MKIWPVRVRMHHRLVAVPMRVRGGRKLGVLMQVMAVVMRIGVDVLDRAVRVLMLMLGGRQHHHRDQREHRRRRLQRRQVVAEDGEGQRRCDKWSAGKHTLCSNRSHPLRGCGVQRNARTIGNGPDHDCPNHCYSTRPHRPRSNTKRQVGRAGDGTLPQRAPRRCHSVNQG